MSLKFSANINFLFKENVSKLSERVRLAFSAGFKAIETPYPSEDDLDAFKNAVNETNIKVTLINIPPGTNDTTKPSAFGLTAVPNSGFETYLDKTIQLAKSVNCKKIHLTAGLKSDTEENCLKIYIDNLKYAANILQKEQMIGVIEPINKYSIPNYFMNSYEKAVKVLDEVNSDNIKLMVDIFHLQLIQGNVTNTFNELHKYIGHIQIAQVPHRNEPNIPGELDFAYIFKLIEENGYNDWVGCEYKPIGDTAEGLKWIKKYGYDF